MSKSLGNGIDPLEMVEQYGADALRFNLVTGNSPGNDMRFYDENGARPCRNFANKIWNASRFVHDEPDHRRSDRAARAAGAGGQVDPLPSCNAVIREVTENMEKYELGVAAQKVYDFIWDDYCDWYIELTKARLQGDDEDGQDHGPAGAVLCAHRAPSSCCIPSCPSSPRRSGRRCPTEGDFLMLQKWPEHRAELDFPEEEEAMELIMDAIRAVRTRRAEMNVPPVQEGCASPWSPPKAALFIAQGVAFLKRLAYAEASGHQSIRVPARHRRYGGRPSPTRPRMYHAPGQIWWTSGEGEGPYSEGADQEQGRAGQACSAKLNNPGFVDKAPAKPWCQAERERAEKLTRPHRQIGGTTGGYGVRPKREGRECGVPLSLPFRLKYHVQTADRPLGDRQFSGEREPCED